MTKFPHLIALIFFAAMVSFCARAQEDSAWDIRALSQIIPSSTEGNVEYNPSTGTAFWTNGIYIHYGNTVLTAGSAWVNTKTGDVQADGRVRIEQGDQLWAGEHITYNFHTRKLSSEQFRTGKWPVLASGENLSGDASNHVYTANHAYVTSDDLSDPGYRVRASRITIVPGKKVQMWNAVFYLEGVPVFYFPYYERNLGPRANNFNFSPGFRSTYGGFLLMTYQWFLGDFADGKIHVDYRTKRGPGAGPDINLQLGRWGDVALKYYYLRDYRPNTSTNNLPFYGNIPHDRQRFYLGYQATPATNFNVKALVNYQSDPLVLHDFFESDYSYNPQPNTFIEADKYWNNWDVDVLTTPRVNSFFSQIERLPEVKLTGLRQQIFNTPFYYDSESSAGWYQSFVANETNGFYAATNGYFADSAARVDTFHQITLPWTFFNWLNVEPRVGGRFTYYSARSMTSGSGEDAYRAVFNTGVRTSFKASQLWVGATNKFLQVDGLRHIIEPSVNYVFVPDPSVPPSQLPQFDSQIPSLLLLPILFPDYNDIDSIDTMNVIRFGLRNTLQTKRNGQLDNLVDWNLLLDWRLDPKPGQNTLDDLYSQLRFKPRSWLTLDSQIRFDLQEGRLNLALHQLTFAPNDRWSWGIGHWYLNNDTANSYFVGQNNYITSTFFYRVNDNWALRASHNFNAMDGRLQEQFYTIYRDLRSFTAALTFRVLDEANQSTDFTVAISLSLKASPNTHVGQDVANPFSLIGE